MQCVVSQLVGPGLGHVGGGEILGRWLVGFMGVKCLMGFFVFGI